MKWLINGGCGFVGSNLADALLRQGHDVTVLDNFSRAGSRQNLAWLRDSHGKDWRLIEADVRDGDSLCRIVREVQPDLVAHLAGQVAMTTSVENPRLDFEVNAMGTFNLLEAVRLACPTAGVLYSSTNKVYGSLDYLRYEERPTRYLLVDYPAGIDESLQLDGCSPYGCSKLAAEQYVRDYARMFGLRSVVFRHSSMYGGRQFATYDQGWIGWFCHKALEMSDPASPQFTICGDGKQVRDVLHADDLVSVYLAAAECLPEAAGEIFNIGGGMENSYSLLELFADLEAQTGHPMRYRRLPWRLGDQKVFVADVAKARRILGWSPKVHKAEGIRRMLEWTRQSR